MSRIKTFRVFLAIVLLVILYEIWPVPFWYLSKKVILPIGEKTSDVFAVLVSPFRFLGRISGLDGVNKNLQDENQALTAEVARLNDNIHLCSGINKEANLSRIQGYGTIVASIVGRTPSSSSQTIIVNVGAKDQVKVGAAVLSSGYLIGQVKKVDNGQSEVHLIFSHDSLIPSVLEKTRETGLTQGGLEGLFLTEIPATTTVSVKDKVLTSGLGGDLPSGILIGETENVVKQGDNLFQSIKLNSPIDVSSLEVVSIVK